MGYNTPSQNERRLNRIEISVFSQTEGLHFVMQNFYLLHVHFALDTYRKHFLLHCGWKLKPTGLGASLAVQGLRLQAPVAGGLGSIPGQGTRPHRPQLKIPHAASKTSAAK